MSKNPTFSWDIRQGLKSKLLKNRTVIEFLKFILDLRQLLYESDDQAEWSSNQILPVQY